MRGLKLTVTKDALDGMGIAFLGQRIAATLIHIQAQGVPPREVIFVGRPAPDPSSGIQVEFFVPDGVSNL